MEWIGSLFFAAAAGYAMLLMLAVPRLKAGHALLSAVCAMLLAAYGGVIVAEWMAPTAYALVYGGLAAFAAGLICAGANVRGLRGRVLSPGMLVYALLSVYAMLSVQGFAVTGHDDLSYWARAVKELHAFDSFYIHGDATMFHRDYIPLLAALQYSLVRVFGWQEALCAVVTAGCVVVSLAAAAEAFRRRWVAVVMAALFLFALRMYGFSIVQLRSDGPMAAVFTAGVLCLISREDDSWASLLPVVVCCAALTGFKIYSGLMYAAVLLCGIAVDWAGAVRCRREWRALAASAVIAAVLVCAMQVSWSVKYNYAEATAAAQAEAALAAHLGRTAESGEAVVSMGALLSGNPRTAELLRSFTPEKIETFLRLAGQTMKEYASSWLVWTWPFLIPAAALCCASGREKRAAALKALALVLLAAVAYLLGLFGSYFVQSETSGAAMHYLSTASAPVLIAALFLTAWLGQDAARAPAAVMVAAMAAGMSLLFSPAELIPAMEKTEYADESALGAEFYEYDLDGLLTEQDHGKRALLLESSYQATEVGSRSGKTHAYAYFGLPLRVLEPVYYTYGDYTQLDSFDSEWLREHIIKSRCELLLVRVEDFLYWEEIRGALELYGDYDDAIGVYDVVYEDGELRFDFRVWEEWAEPEED